MKPLLDQLALARADAACEACDDLLLEDDPETIDIETTTRSAWHSLPPPSVVQLACGDGVLMREAGAENFAQFVKQDTRFELQWTR